MNLVLEKMSEFTELTPEEALAIEQSFPVKTFLKGSFLLKEGQIAKDAYIVFEGCVRKYSITEGIESTLDLFIEGDSIVDLNSLANKKPSRNYYICVEDATLGIINEEKEKALYKKFPRFEHFCRVEFEKMMGEKEDKKETFSNKTPEEKYLHLLNERPDLMNRVPQYQIASYLGMTPETLSRVRRRVFQNN